MKIKVNEEIDKNKWLSFINENKNGNAFQGPLMYNFLKTQKKIIPLAISCELNGNIKGVVLATIYKSYIPFINTRCVVYGGPIVTQKEFLNILINKLNSFLKYNTIYIEIRNFIDQNDNILLYNKHGYNFVDHFNILVKLKSKEELTKNINKGKLRQIKKSIENGCIIKESNDKEEIFKFYQILKTLYRNRIHKPLPDWRFFDSFRKHTDLGKYFIIIYKGDVVGGIMCPIFNNITIYEWYIANRNDFENIYPGVLSTWAPITYGFDKNFSYFDFMGAGNQEENFGVRQFKMQFGGELVNYGRFQLINNKIFYKLGKIYIERLKYAI